MFHFTKANNTKYVVHTETCNLSNILEILMNSPRENMSTKYL